MVLGLRSKNKKGSSIQIDYVIHLVEIKPWPPLESRRSTQSLLLQWQNGDQGTGSFSIVGGGVDNIVVNESFTISITLQPDKKARDKFRKSLLEFSLIEPRKDKVGKEQVLGTATLNIAEYGVIEHDFSIGVPFNCKKSFKSSLQPVLFIQIEPFDKGSSKSSPNNGSSIPSLDRDGEDLSPDMDGDHSEIASFTDDDISSHSSLTIASSTFEASRESPSRGNKVLHNVHETLSEITRNVKPLAKSMSSVSDSVNNHNPKSKFSERSMTSIQGKVSAHTVPSTTTTSFRDHRGIDVNSRNYTQHLDHGDINDEFHETRKMVETIPQIVNIESTESAPIEVETSISSIEIGSQSNRTNHRSSHKRIENQSGSAVVDDGYVDVSSVHEKKERNLLRNINKFPEDDIVDFTTETLEPQIARSHLRHAKSHNYDSSGRNRLITEQYNNVENGTKERIANREGSTSKIITCKGKESSTNTSPNGKGKNTSKKEGGGLKTEIPGAETEWNSKIEMLEGELTEAAALEVGLYSIVAEHGSSMNKVHASARRLSRFYLHACRADSRIQLGSAARAIISGLVLVSKACGNDVPRLTFWLSNSIMLRAIVSQAVSDTPNLYMKKSTEKSNGQTHSNSIKKQGNSPSITNSTGEESDGWEDTEAFIYALEKTESWIFTRIVESIWWQDLTQHMQPAVAKTSALSMKKSNSSKYGLGDQEQGNFSVELWKKAFKDACERICPIRAQGNECGCLSVMTRMVMERLVIRLDVAMFNAILRESPEEMPSDPLSDPITEPRVLPIVAGKLSFGAGAQLKNAIGNWTRWLSDLFETEDIDSPNDNDESFCEETTPESFKAFRLLNALSDVMMLPFEMLTDKSTRKEVCPALGPALIKKVFSSFLPDQFCPYPIPPSVIDALDSEDDSDISTEMVSSHPCNAPPTVYSPPVVTSLKYKGFTLEVGNRNVTSDDELDEMDTNLNLIFKDSLRIRPSAAATKLGLMPKGDNRRRKVVRYNLLWNVWKDC